MVSSNEAERLSYVDYKVEVNKRLIRWWVSYIVDHPEDAARADLRLAVLQPRLDAAKAMQRASQKTGVVRRRRTDSATH